MTDEQMTQQARAMMNAWPMTRSEDNALLRIAAEREDFYRQTASAIDVAMSLIAFAGLCVLLYLALHIGPVLP